MARKVRRSDLDEVVPPSIPDDRPPPRPRKFLRRLVMLSVVVALAVVMAPQIVANTPLLQHLVAWATAGVQGHVGVGGASLGWLDTPTIENIEVLDEKGRPVVTAESIAGDRTLWQWATAPTELGRFRIVKPQIHLAVFDDGTTNLERLLGEMLKSKSTGPTTPVDVAVEIVDGTLHVHDQATAQEWVVGGVNAVGGLPSDGSSPLVADVQGALATTLGPRRLSAQCSFKNGALTLTADGAAPLLPQGDAAITCEGLPLELVGVVARRFLPGLTLAGMAQGDLRARFDLAAAVPAGDVSGRLTVANLAVGGPKLAGDEIRLARVDMPLRARLEGRRLTLDQLAADCDLASLAVVGTVDDYRRLSTATTLAAFADAAAHCEGRATAQLNLARVAQALPHVLRLHDDIEVTGGDVTLTATGGAAGTALRQQLELAVANLSARRGAQIIAWPEALRATVSLADTGTGPTFERIDCTSDFLTLNGTNGPQAFQLQAQYDLAKLGERVAQFVDLGLLQLQGNGTAEATWQREATGRFNVEARAAVNNFALMAPGFAPWNERQLMIGLDAAGRADGFLLTSLDSAEAGLQSDGDQLAVRLLEPVADARSADAVWPLVISGQGQLASWLNRVRPFAGLPTTMVAEGTATLNATAKLRLPADLELVQSQLVAQPFRLAGYGLVIDEPSLDLQAAGRFRSTAATVSEATLIVPSLYSQVRQLVWKAGSGAGELVGDLSLRADVARLWAMLGHGPTPANPGALQLAGMFQCGARLQAAGQTTSVALNGVINNFAAAQAGGAAWQEPQVTLIGSGVYDPARDALAFDRLEIGAAALRMLLQGKIAELSASRIVDCTGEVEYDLARLTPVAQSYLGAGAVFEGKQKQPLELHGPTADPTRGGAFALDKLNGAAALGWQGANLYGFQLGAATLDARLNQGLLRVNPTEVPVNTGKVRLAPSLRLGPGPMELALDSGVLVDHVSITPEMANQRLKYVLPILSGVAQVSGQFSIALDELRIPLDNPQAGTMAGKMTVHAIDVGPNYLIQELAPLLQQPLSVSLKRESIVDFKLIQGRIYHQGLEFVFPEVTVRTSGSVGLDQTLSLNAEITLPAKLLGMPGLASAAGTHSVQVPIAGTLQRPALDGRSIASVMRQAIGGAAQGLLQQGMQQGESAVQQGLNRGLERLLGPGAFNTPPGNTTK